MIWEPKPYLSPISRVLPASAIAVRHIRHYAAASIVNQMPPWWTKIVMSQELIIYHPKTNIIVFTILVIKHNFTFPAHFAPVHWSYFIISCFFYFSAYPHCWECGWAAEWLTLANRCSSAESILTTWNHVHWVWSCMSNELYRLEEPK